MGKNLKRVLIGLGALLAIGAIVALRFFTATNAFTTTASRPFAGCSATPLPGSADDIAIDRSTGIAFLSVLDRRAVAGDPLLTGTILKLDLNQSGSDPVPATAGTPPGFRPQGLSLWSHADQPKRLFVVSHPLDANGHEEQTIEQFEEQSDGLFHHQRSIRDALFVHPSDLAAVGPEEFYLVNDSGARNSLTRAFELVLRLHWSDVVYYDGAHASVAASGRSFADGVTASADGLKLFLAESGAQQLLIFDRDTDTGTLYWSGLIEVAGGPDNLDIAEDGSLWAAVHPNIWARMRNVSDGTPAATMILRLASPVNGFVKPQPIYVNDGTEFSAGSVGAEYRGRLFIGSVTEKKLLVCPWSSAAS